MTDETGRRVQQLEERVDQLERDLSRAVRLIGLAGRGHATVKEQGELRELAERHPRWPFPATPD